jgi:hypothetical protein
MWVLVRSTIVFHKSLFNTLFVQFLIFIVCRSILTSSSHLFFGLPIGLEVNDFHLYILVYHVQIWLLISMFFITLNFLSKCWIGVRQIWHSSLAERVRKYFLCSGRCDIPELVINAWLYEPCGWAVLSVEQTVHGKVNCMWVLSI